MTEDYHDTYGEALQRAEDALFEAVINAPNETVQRMLLGDFESVVMLKHTPDEEFMEPPYTSEDDDPGADLLDREDDLSFEEKLDRYGKSQAEAEE